MRGEERRQRAMLVVIDPDKRVAKDHPLRGIRQLAEAALARLSPVFDVQRRGATFDPAGASAQGLAADGAVMEHS